MQKNIRLPSDDEVLALYQSGKTLAAIGAAYGVSPCTVHRVVHRAQTCEVPAWVPDMFRKLYVDLTNDYDEFEAARECRRLKRELMQKGAKNGAK